jgi:5-methylcytosine-specific restriction endonuclease McrA
MASRTVYVELGEEGQPIRIFNNQKAAAAANVVYVALMTYSTAVKSIRRQIWERDGRRCTHCGAPVSWTTMQMHERTWRGRGGEISLANGTTLCYNDHKRDPIAGHGKRQPQW